MMNFDKDFWLLFFDCFSQNGIKDTLLLEAIIISHWVAFCKPRCSALTGFVLLRECNSLFVTLFHYDFCYNRKLVHNIHQLCKRECVKCYFFNKNVNRIFKLLENCSNTYFSWYMRYDFQNEYVIRCYWSCWYFSIWIYWVGSCQQHYSSLEGFVLFDENNTKTFFLFLFTEIENKYIT